MRTIIIIGTHMTFGGIDGVGEAFSRPARRARWAARSMMTAPEAAISGSTNMTEIFPEIAARGKGSNFQCHRSERNAMLRPRRSPARRFRGP
jgi:hypothetical protein